MIDSADYLRSIGGMDGDAHARLHARQGHDGAASMAPLSPVEIRTLREGADLTLVAFARHLNVRADQVSQWELGSKRPSGAALALLNLIRRKGIAAIL